MNNQLAAELDALALSLLDRCKAEEVALDTRVDVFKAVTQYYLGYNRTTKGKAPETPAGATFTDIMRTLNHEGGTA